MIEIIRYNESNKEEWNQFVANSANGVFLFNRDYMDYHSPRFKDHSLLIYHNTKLAGIFPANEKDTIIHSHQGLTFGGLIIQCGTSSVNLLLYFENFLNYYKNLNYTEIIYKCVPHIYHKVLAEADQYALSRFNATCFREDLSTTITLRAENKYKERRIRAIKKAVKLNIKVNKSIEEIDWSDYWKLLSKQLFERYQAKPVHSFEEIRLLANRFPNNIHLYTAKNEHAKIIAGVLIYENEKVAHAQYISSDYENLNSGALDLIFHRLINKEFSSKDYFDFGISTEQDGKYLNTGLIEFKEGFGGGSIVHSFYKIPL